MKHLEVLVIFVVVRIASVFLIQTCYVADEYFQSLEVAHKFVFGYGELTWEWKQGIRSHIQPLLISFLYKILQLTGLDYVYALIILPRIMQALLSAYADYRFYCWSGNKKWSVFIISSSHFWFYTGSRTLLNTFDTALTTIALSYFPWPNAKNGMSLDNSDYCLNGISNKNNVNKFIWILGLVCAVRPTAAIQWLPLCIFHLKVSQESVSKLLLNRYLPIGLIVLVISIIIDSYAFGSFLVTPYQFLKVNVIQNIATFYGSFPWHWYLTCGIPILLGVNFIPFILGTYYVLKNRYTCLNELWMLGSMVFTVTIYSFLPHKEFRFILPLLPMALHIVAGYMAKWSYKADMLFVWIASGILLVGNVIPAYYVGLIHQRGCLDVMSDLRDIAERNPADTSFLFLMPCHSTPLYSHLHVNVSTRYLTCLPNFDNVENYKDEADVFYDSPAKWMQIHYPPNGPLPSHIIAFDVLQAFLTDILSLYRPVKQIFYTNIILDGRAGHYIIIYELVKSNKTSIGI